MMGLSIAKLWRTVCSQNVDFPAPGGPTKRINFFGGTSCIWDRDKSIPYYMPMLKLL
jgi:hypothetical protein